MAKSRFAPFRLRFHNASVLFFSLLLIILQGLIYLDIQKIIFLPDGFAPILRHVSVVIATLFITSLLLRLTIKRFFRLFEEPEERIFYSKIYSWTLYSLSIFVILYYFGVSLGNITIFLGLIATGLAFAIRDVLLSFFGWMILLRKNPFRIGDYIRIGEDEGKVIHIGTFYVLLDNTPDIPQDFTRVPNRLFLEKSISNLGKSEYHDTIKFQLARLPEDSQQLLFQIQKQVGSITKNTKHSSAFFNLENEKLLLNIECMISFDKRKTLRSEIIQMVYLALGDKMVFPK